jgi:hypothetical protein
VRRSRVVHLMIPELLRQCLVCDLHICQPRVPEGRSGLLDHPTLPFLVCPFLGLGWHVFWLSRMHTSWSVVWHYRPFDQWWSRSVRANWRGLYDSVDRSRSVRAN